MRITILRKNLAERFNEISNFNKGLIVLLLTWGLYFVQLWPRMLYRKEDGIYSGWIGVWADWAVHFTYAGVFTFKDISDWFTTHPLYIHNKFTYPFVADAISGILIRLGWDYIPAFIIPSILTTVLLLFMLYKFNSLFIKNWKTNLLSITLFLLSGGLGFVYFIRDAIQNLEVIKFPPHEYTNWGEFGIHWINVITGELLPQRALLLGMALTLVILYKFHKWNSRKTISLKKVILLGIFSSLIFVTHVHSFIVLIIISACYFISNRKNWVFWMTYAVSAGLPSILIYLGLFAGDIGTSFMKWHPGWLSHPDSKDYNFFIFWFKNWGLFLPASLVALVSTKFYKKPVFVAAVLLFVLANLILFQPFDWDNAKVFTWVYYLFSIPLALTLQKLWVGRSIILKIGVGLSILIFCASGLIDLYRLSKTSELTNLMYSKRDLEIAQQFIKISDPTDVVLSADKHNHWVSNLAGRQVLLGYRGWMWTYGIDYSEVESDMKTMFAGLPETEKLFEKYSIDFVVIGPAEKADFNANPAYFNSKYEKVLSNSEYEVFRIDDRD